MRRAGPFGLVVGAPRTTAAGKQVVGVRLDGKGRTMYYSLSQLKRLPGVARLGLSLECLRAFRDEHADLVAGLSTHAVWQHLLQPLAEVCECSLALAIRAAADRARSSGPLPAECEPPADRAAVGGARAEYTGEANVYVSFAGETNFESLLDGLAEFERQLPRWQESVAQRYQVAAR